MKEVTAAQVVEILGSLGILPGDTLLVHSALQFLGKPSGGPGMYYHALAEAIRLPEEGTLAVPTFNFGFAQGKPYDPKNTPSQKMGVFAEYIRTLPEAQRSPHPMQSLAAVGRCAADLAGRDTPSAFDPGSAFERLIELDGKLLLLGADIQAASIFHYSEQRARVPYRYWKEFSGQVLTPLGWLPRTYRMFVRDLELDPQIELYPLQARLQARGQWLAAQLNYGWISTCRLRHFIAAADEILAEDPWTLVTNR